MNVGGVKNDNGLFRKMIDKKISITGHTKNIGKYIYDKFPNSLGFSRSNGYDIQNKLHRKLIIEKSIDCDVFINNAPAGFSQSELCLELWNEWKDQNKIIINVGSRIAEDNIQISLEKSHLLEYRMHKQSLKKLSEDLSNINTFVQVKYVWFGYVGTPEILKKYSNFTKNDYMSIDKAAEIIINEFI